MACDLIIYNIITHWNCASLQPQKFNFTPTTFSYKRATSTGALVWPIFLRCFLQNPPYLQNANASPTMNPSVILTAHLTSMIYLLSAHRVILQLRSTSWTHRLSWETMLHNSINCSSLTGTTDLHHCDHSPLVELVNVTHFFRPKGFVFNCDIKKICNLSLSRSNKRRQHRAHTPPHSEFHSGPITASLIASMAFFVSFQPQRLL